jgi:hypothetical protein
MNLFPTPEAWRRLAGVERSDTTGNDAAFLSPAILLPVIAGHET